MTRKDRQSNTAACRRLAKAEGLTLAQWRQKMFEKMKAHIEKSKARAAMALLDGKGEA